MSTNIFVVLTKESILVKLLFRKVEFVIYMTINVELHECMPQENIYHFNTMISYLCQLKC